MAALFVKELLELLTKLREAVTAVDAKAIEHASHKLKGSIGNFVPQSAFESVLKLEGLCSGGSLSAAELAYAEFEKEIKRLIPATVNLSGLEVRR